MVINPPLVVNIKIYPSSNITLNCTVFLNATINGGTGPFNFTWTIYTPDFNQHMVHGQNITINANESGTYSIELIVLDKFGYSNIYSYEIIYYNFNVS